MLIIYFMKVQAKGLLMCVESGQFERGEIGLREFDEILGKCAPES